MAFGCGAGARFAMAGRSAPGIRHVAGGRKAGRTGSLERTGGNAVRAAVGAPDGNAVRTAVGAARSADGRRKRVERCGTGWTLRAGPGGGRLERWRSGTEPGRCRAALGSARSGFG
jgi:hypothetical protein